MSLSRCSLASVLVVAAILMTGCPGSVATKAVEAPAEVSLRKRPAASSKYLLRRPSTPRQASEGALSADWGKFEIGLFDSGLTMVDSALLEELLRSNASASYEAIRQRTGADVLIEVVEIGDIGLVDLGVDTPRHRLKCQVSRMTIKLVDVGTGSMLGTLDFGRSACPDDMVVEWPASRTEDLIFNVNGTRLPDSPPALRNYGPANAEVDRS